MVKASAVRRDQVTWPPKALASRVLNASARGKDRLPSTAFLARMESDFALHENLLLFIGCLPDSE